VADHSSTAKAQSEDKKTINILNQTNGKKKLGMDKTSSGEVASMRGSDFVNIVGQRIKERLTHTQTSFIENSIEAGILRSGKGVIHASVGLGTALVLRG
jgi:hypothetical protein